MKQFLYLDIDIVNSIIAQSEQGLMQSLSNEQLSCNTESGSSKIAAGISAQLGASIVKLVKAETNLSGSLESLKEGTTTSTSREIISKTMHDAAFDIACDYISPLKVENRNQRTDSTGNYIEMTRVFDFIDFDYFEGLFSAGGIVDYMKKSAAEQIESNVEKKKEELNREEARRAKNYFKDQIANAVANSNKQFDDIKMAIKALRGIIPYNRMLISTDGYLIPLSTKYFRIDPIDLGFKYGGEITCVGMITNIIGENVDSSDERSAFAYLKVLANSTLKSLLSIGQTSLCVIHPIAIYYDVNKQVSR